MPKTVDAAYQLELQGLRLAGVSVEDIGRLYAVSGPTVWRTTERPLPENPLVVPYYPPVVALIKKLAVVAVDPDQWYDRAIESRYDVTHAQATRWFQGQQEHLRRLGYQTLLLWQDELASPALPGMLRYRLGRVSNRVGARNCDLGEIESREAQAFFQQHHLQGGVKACVNLCLRFNGQPVACMSFNRGHTCRGDADAWLLQRFATSTIVPGAASRLLSAFRKQYQGDVISYSDQRYAPGGKLYQTLGFTLVDDRCKPDYRYWRAGTWRAKSLCQRKHLLDEAGALDVGQTETELADGLGYRRCYDLGKRTWRLTT
jgi:hypothetical protein